MIYRREIDGLRALAVLPVMFFHAGFQNFSGGFVGVDVFFVISGYLITSIILIDLENDSFSLINFYERRARRILPALFFITLICVPFAWFLLLPADLKDFSQSLAAVSLFASNFLFYIESSYFEASSEFKPLLHTWSLAVEEQFYLVFPLLFVFLWRLGSRWVIIVLTTIFIASLTLAEWASHRMPAAAFYLLPTRCWELFLGSFAAFYLIKSEHKDFRKTIRELGSWLGMLLILYSIFAYSESTPFPGVYALVPTVGTLLLILFSNDKTVIGRFMGNKILVGIGLVSYSAYLWHQPLLVFARHFGIPNSNKFIYLFLILSSLLLAYFSWRFIERPFRHKSLISKRNILFYSILIGVFIFSLGFYGHKKEGDLGQLSNKQTILLDFYENKTPDWNYIKRENIDNKFRFECDFYNHEGYRSGNLTDMPRRNISRSCYVKKSKDSKVIFLWGDSHAQQLYYGLNKTLPADFEILQIASSSCIPKLDAEQSNINYCEQSNWMALEQIKKVKPHIVIIGQRSGHDSINMEKFAKYLKGIGVKRVIFTGPTPKWVPNLPAVVARMLPRASVLPERTSSNLDENYFALDKKLKSKLLNSSEIEYISLIEHFCNEEGCLIYYNPYTVDSLTSWDQTHLTPVASFQLAKNLLSRTILEN